MSDERERVEHPSWCDGEECTAVAFRPTNEEYRQLGAGRAGEHRSRFLAVPGYGPAKDLRIQLLQSVAPWVCGTYLRMATADGELSWTTEAAEAGIGFSLYELLGKEVADSVREFPTLYAERFPYLADTTSAGETGQLPLDVVDDEADEATADASMPRDPVELEERMTAEFLADEEAEERSAITNPDEPRRKYEFAGCGDCHHEDCVPSRRCWLGRPDAWISKEPGVLYKLTVNAEQRVEGTLQDVRAAVAELVTKRLEDAPERVAGDAQMVNLSFNSGAVQESLDLRGDWYTVFDAFGEEPLRIRITKEE